MSQGQGIGSQKPRRQKRKPRRGRPETVADLLDGRPLLGASTVCDIIRQIGEQLAADHDRLKTRGLLLPQLIRISDSGTIELSKTGRPKTYDEIDTSLEGYFHSINGEKNSREPHEKRLSLRRPVSNTKPRLRNMNGIRLIFERSPAVITRVC